METATTKLQEDIIFRSKFPDIHIPNHLPLHSYIFQNIPHFSTNPCLINGVTNAVNYTFAETEHTSKKLAAGLTKLGLRHGDAVLLLLPNSPEFVLSFLAATYSGAVAALPNPFYTPAQIAEASNAKIIITQSSDVEKIRQYAAANHAPVVCVDAPPSPECLRFSDLISADVMDPPKIDPDDVAAVMYSSGTTAPPKAVVVTHRGLVNAVGQIVDGENPNLFLDSNDVLVSVLPLFHIYGLLFLLWAIRVGSGTVVMREFDVGRFVEAIEKCGVTIVPLLPPMAVAIVKSPVVEKFDLSSVRTVVCGAAPLGKELEDAVRLKFPNAKLGQAYGMTEACAVAMSLAFAKEPSEFKSGGCGTVVRNAEIKIVDVETSASLGRNQPGEIYIRGDQIMKGYLNNPDATEKKIDKEGWLHTGDIGFVDDDDEIFIVDRIIEMIKYKEFLVAPAELEDLLLTHPNISEAAVIPMKDEEAGEVPVAFVVKKKGSTITEGEIKQFVSKQVLFYKKINRVFFVDVIPKTQSGKILRKDLRARLADSLLQI